jgi:SAM-dependent methyltransferase
MTNDVSDVAYWAERWRDGATGWDLGGPCPVFVDLLCGDHAPPPGCRVAFPGCGSGHDVRLFAEHGYEVTGFDFAHHAPDLPIERLDVFELGRRYPESFDAVVEYTCYCAIDPSRREEYAASMRDALRPGGLLIALLFPVEEREEGPPFGVDESEIETVLGVGMEIVSVTTPRDSVQPRLGRERLALLRKR